jgi:hypothetical protein
VLLMAPTYQNTFGLFGFAGVLKFFVGWGSFLGGFVENVGGKRKFRGFFYSRDFCEFYVLWGIFCINYYFW